MRKYHVISTADGCWQYLGGAMNYEKALGIAYKLIHECLDKGDKFTTSLGFDEANHKFEEINVTIPETEHHSTLEFPIIIFYEDDNS